MVDPDPLPVTSGAQYSGTAEHQAVSEAVNVAAAISDSSLDASDFPIPKRPLKFNIHHDLSSSPEASRMQRRGTPVFSTPLSTTKASSSTLPTMEAEMYATASVIPTPSLSSSKFGRDAVARLHDLNSPHTPRTVSTTP